MHAYATVRRLPSARSRAALGAALLVLVSLITGLYRPALAASLPSPDAIHAAVTSSTTAPTGSPSDAVPAVLVKQGQAFTLTVTLTYLGQSAAFNGKSTTLSVKATGPGTLSSSTISMAGGVSSQDFSLSYSTYAPNVSVTVSVPNGRQASTVAPGTSNLFDVQKYLDTYASSPGVPFRQGEGAGGCADATTDDPVCGVAILPHGAGSGGVLLSVGGCDPVRDVNCKNPLVVQMIANFNDALGNPLYSKTDPATVLVICDKTACKGKGVSSYNVYATLSSINGANPALSVSPPCAVKGQVNVDSDFCTDYVTSHRDNAGDLLLYVLMDRDWRGLGA